MVISADTAVLASCGMDRTVKLWDLNTLGLKNTLMGHPKVKWERIRCTN